MKDVMTWTAQGRTGQTLTGHVRTSTRLTSYMYVLRHQRSRVAGAENIWRCKIPVVLLYQLPSSVDESQTEA